MSDKIKHVINSINKLDWFALDFKHFRQRSFLRIKLFPLLARNHGRMIVRTDANFELIVATRSNSRQTGMILSRTSPARGRGCVLFVFGVDVIPEHYVQVSLFVFNHLQLHGVPLQRHHWLVR